MEIFWRLFLAHFLADFTLQTDWINKMKREKTLGVIIHVFIHLVVTYALLLSYISHTWFKVGSFELKGYLMVLIICLFHFTVDQLRIYIIKNKIYPDNALNFIIDQFFHLYFIFIFSPFGNVPVNFSGEKIIMVLSFIVVVSHTSTVLIYFIEKDISGLSFPSFDQKYFMIFERLILFGFFLIEGKWFILLALLWIVQIYYIKIRKIVDISNINFVMSITLSAVFGLLARYYYYLGG